MGFLGSGLVCPGDSGDALRGCVWPRGGGRRHTLQSCRHIRRGRSLQWAVALGYSLAGRCSYARGRAGRLGRSFAWEGVGIGVDRTHSSCTMRMAFAVAASVKHSGDRITAWGSGAQGRSMQGRGNGRAGWLAVGVVAGRVAH